MWKCANNNVPINNVEMCQWNNLHINTLIH